MEAPLAIPGTFLPERDAILQKRTNRPSTAFWVHPSTPSSRHDTHRKPPLDYFSSQNANSQTRKRPRVNTNDVSSSRLQSKYGSTVTASSLSYEALSPAPLVNEKYRLVGGSETPISVQLRREVDDQQDFEQDCRPSRYTHRSHSAPDSPPRTPANGNDDIDAQAFTGGVSRGILAFTGNLVGKVFNFCWNTAFHGFFAGEGKGYHLDIGTPTVAPAQSIELNEKEDVFRDEYRSRSIAQLPGEFIDNEFDNERVDRRLTYEEDVSPVPHQGSATDSTLRSSWVMVNEPTPNQNRPIAVRRKSRPNAASLYPRPLSRVSSTSSRPKLQSHRSSGSNASYASPRALDLSGQAESRPQSPEDGERRVKRAKPSVTSPRISRTNSSPLPRSPEVTKFEKRLRKNDLKQDESIRRLNLQMQEMIHEARQALGTKVEVGDEFVDDSSDNDSPSLKGHGW